MPIDSQHGRGERWGGSARWSPVSAARWAVRSGRVLGLAAALLAGCGPSGAAGPAPERAPGTVEARCVRVDDGDSLNVILGEREAKVRLAGIDCPEKGQPFADAARDFTRARVLDRTVTLEVVDTDRYGRLVARVRVAGGDLNRELVAAGLAWHSTLHSSDPALAAAQQLARSEGRGLWSEPDPVPPWQHRKEQREARDAASASPGG